MQTLFTFGLLKHDTHSTINFERWQPAARPVELQPVATAANQPIDAALPIDLDGMICFRFERNGAAVLVSVKPLYIPSYEQDENDDWPIVVIRDIEWQTDKFGYPAFISRMVEV